LSTFDRKFSLHSSESQNLRKAWLVDRTRLQTELFDRWAGSSVSHVRSQCSSNIDCAPYWKAYIDYPQGKRYSVSLQKEECAMGGCQCWLCSPQTISHGAKKVGKENPFVEIMQVHAMRYAIEVLARLDRRENIDCKNKKMETLGGPGIVVP
jgi:hypothetical protein